MPKSSPGSAPIATQALDVVEFDGHRLDVRLKVVVRDPMGFEQEFEIERIWLLVIVDGRPGQLTRTNVWSRAVLGYHVSLNREYSRYDVIRTIENVLSPHRPRQFTLPGVGYGDRGGFPSGKLTERGYASWQWFKLDNAKAIRLFAFLIGQEGLRAVKTAFQQENKTQIVARLMVEELRFHGLRDAADTATGLQSYDTTCFPKGSDWIFTRFFAPIAVAAGYKLADDAQVLWNAFEDLHNKSDLPGELEIPMESFAGAVEITLKSCWDRDPLSLRPEPALWPSAVKACGYVQARIAIRKELMPTAARVPVTA